MTLRRWEHYNFDPGFFHPVVFMSRQSPTEVYFTALARIRVTGGGVKQAPSTQPRN